MAARLVLVASVAALNLVQAFGPDRALAVRFGWSLVAILVATAAFVVLARAAVQGDYRPSLTEALGLAVLLRLAVLPLAPALSDDIYRYLFEGRLVLEGINPYLTPPNAEQVAYLRGPTWSLINNPSIPAAYPPAMQLALAAGAWISPAPLGMKIVFGGLDLMVFVALWFGLPLLGAARERAILYGYCPLLVLHFAGEAHGDSLAVLCTVLALLAAQRRRGALAGALLAVATAGKLIPAVLLPFVLRDLGTACGAPRFRRQLAALAAFVLGLAALYWPFWAPPDELLRGTLEYTGRWRSNDSLYALVHLAAEGLHALGLFGGSSNVWLVEPQRLAKFLLAGLALVVLGRLWRLRLPAPRAGFWFFVFFVAAAPTVHPWYVAFLLPFLCLYPSTGMLVFTGTVFLAYHVLPDWIAAHQWHEHLWVKAIEYLPFYAGALAGLRGARNSPS